jgi:hypothetical protein
MKLLLSVVSPSHTRSLADDNYFIIGRFDTLRLTCRILSGFCVCVQPPA